MRGGAGPALVAAGVLAGVLAGPGLPAPQPRRAGPPARKPGLPAAKPVRPAAAMPPTAAPGPSREAEEFFEKRVRPVLVEQCYSCHSSRLKAPMAGLRVDGLAHLLRGGERGPALVPGKPETSLLIRALAHREPRLAMPPKGRLPEEQINALTEWVRMGAPWPAEASAARPAPAAPPGGVNVAAGRRHWAFQPLRPVPVPAVRNTAWPRTPEDAFILARLEARGLAPAPPAERRTWLRRVTYDLTGLPPTPDELHSFLTDTAPGAYERVVDRLLASPRYGERWARHWLDLVRYAETDGHEFDFEKPGAWRYRDYVIRALNEDVPYHRFVMEHLAGDVLPQPRLRPDPESGVVVNESLLGTAHYWLGEGKHSPVDLLVDEAERVENQVDVFGKAFLGLTLQCARCHDHKFDPLTQKDYTALAGYFKSARYAVSDAADPAPSRTRAAALETLDTRLQQPLARGLAEAEPVRDFAALLLAAAAPPGDEAARVRWEYLRERAAKEPADPLHPWAVLSGKRGEQFVAARARLLETLRARATASGAPPGEVLQPLAAGYPGWYVSGPAFGSGPVVRPGLTATAGGGLRAVRMGSADSGRHTERMLGALRSRNFTVQRRYVLVRASGRQGRINLILDGFQRIRYPIYGGLTVAVDSPTPRWHAIDAGKWLGHRAYLELLDAGPGYLAVDDVRVADALPAGEPPLPEVLALLGEAESETPEGLARGYGRIVEEAAGAWVRAAGANSADAPGLLQWLLGSGFLTAGTPAARACGLDTDPGAAALLRQRLEAEEAVPQPVVVMAAAEGSGHDDRLHLRGSVQHLGPTVPRRLPEVWEPGQVPAPPQNATGRLELARRLVERGGPLLARVVVNRVWQHHFGEGLVRTPDDFGTRGERPTHPELLEYVAERFVREGWSLKKLHRRLVLSSTYRLASRGAGAAGARAEAVDPQNRLLHRAHLRRLEAEAIRDGMLAVSGRLDSRMYGPGVLPHLTPYMEGRGRPEHSGPLDGAGRRSIYLNIRRNFLPPLFLAFDYPIPFSTMGKRSVSTVPAQALALMNNPFVVQQAGVWARKVLAGPGKSAEERVRGMYLEAYARPPTAGELAEALAFLEEVGREYGSLEEPRAWAELAHVLFNVKEFIFIH